MAPRHPIERMEQHYRRGRKRLMKGEIGDIIPIHGYRAPKSGEITVYPELAEPRTGEIFELIGMKLPDDVQGKLDVACQALLDHTAERFGPEFSLKVRAAGVQVNATQIVIDLAPALGGSGE